MRPPQWLGHILRRLADVGALASDGEDERLRKALLVLTASLVTSLATIWVVTYWALGLTVAAVIPLTYQVVSTVSLVTFLRTKRYRLFRFGQLSLMLLLPVLLQFSLGGFVAASGVLLWSFTAPLGALMFAGTRQAVPWFVAYVALTGLSGGLDGVVASKAHAIPETVRVALFVLNISGVSTTAFLLLTYFVRQRDLAMERSERLLLNVLPRPIAQRLKNSEGVIAEALPEATVLFADIVEFTPLSERMSAEAIVELLNEVFSEFDDLADRFGLEKIKTIGDAYMVAGGIPDPRPDHAEAVAEMALAMRDEAAPRVAARDGGLTLRIGIDTGPVVAGVIGRRKFIYDLWGDTVNTASRMESNGVAGGIQVTERVYERLRDRFSFEPRGEVDVKGKGRMRAYLLVGHAVPAGDRADSDTLGAEA